MMPFSRKRSRTDPARPGRPRQAWLSPFIVLLAVFGLLGIGASLGIFPAAAQGDGSGSAPVQDGVHLGVASCASDNCHGKYEYEMWSQETDPHRIDLHHRAYTVLLGERGLRIAHNLGLPDAASADTCLVCHADNVPPNRRGPVFRIQDGVGCEACHGGASGWLGQHLLGQGHKANVAAGLYPTEQPEARAERCLTCHLGDDTHRMTHRIMGAGHPPLPFELDTFTAIEPAHFTVDKSYVERKGPVNNARTWAVGLAVNVVKYLDRLLDPENAQKGIEPELVLFDCDACHHAMRQLRWRPNNADARRPGQLRLNDANAELLQAIAARTDPGEAATLKENIAGLRHATQADWGAVQQAARQMRETAVKLIPVLSSHDFTTEDMKSLADGVIAIAVSGGNVEYSMAKQTTFGLEAILTAMTTAGYVKDEWSGIDPAMDEIYKALGDDTHYDPDAYLRGLADLKRALP